LAMRGSSARSSCAAWHSMSGAARARFATGTGRTSLEPVCMRERDMYSIYIHMCEMYIVYIHTHTHTGDRERGRTSVRQISHIHYTYLYICIVCVR